MSTIHQPPSWTIITLAVLMLTISICIIFIFEVNVCSVIQLVHNMKKQTSNPIFDKAPWESPARTNLFQKVKK